MDRDFRAPATRRRGVEGRRSTPSATERPPTPSHGLGADYHPAPWRILRYDVERRGYVIPCEKDQLENAPGIRREDLSGWDDALSRDDIYAFYRPSGARPYWIV